MVIQKTAITVTYKRINGIKKAYYDNEESLKVFFNEATVLPVPNDAPAEIPRIIIKTLNEHAQLNISPIATTFEIYYDNEFQRNWRLCLNYIIERMTKVFDFLNTLTNNTYEYIGLITEVIYDEVKEHGTKKIAKNLLNSQKIKNIHDINIKYTFIEDKTFFVNIMLQNARIFKNNFSLNEPGCLQKNVQINESIGAVIDINDRYAFNMHNNYESDSSTLNDLVEHMDNIINNKLELLIEKGEY